MGPYQHVQEATTINTPALTRSGDGTLSPVRPERRARSPTPPATIDTRALSGGRLRRKRSVGDAWRRRPSHRDH